MPPTAPAAPHRPSASPALGPLARRRRRLTRRWLTAGLVAAAGGVAVATLAPPAPATRPAVVARRDLPVGAVLTAGEVVGVQRAADTLPDGLLRPDEVDGSVLTTAVRRGEVLTDARTTAGSLLAGQPPGTLATSVEVGDPALLSGLAPGVHVDVLARTEDPVTGTPTGAARIAEDVVVLRVPSSPDPTGLLGTQGGPDSTSVLVAVDSSTAALLAAAAGRTVLAVRSA